MSLGFTALNQIAARAMLAEGRCLIERPLSIRLKVQTSTSWGRTRKSGIKIGYVNLTLSADSNELMTHVLHLVRCHFLLLRQSNTRSPNPNVLAGFNWQWLSSVSEALSQRAATEGDTCRRETRKHASDENRHGQIFAHALKQLNKQVIDFSLPQPKPEDKPDERRRAIL